MFHDAEKYKSEAKLVLIFYIYKAFVGLNDERLIETMMSDDLFLDTVGVFECNNLSPCGQRKGPVLEPIQK